MIDGKLLLRRITAFSSWCTEVISVALVMQFVIAGICFSLLFPIFRTPDEEFHYKAALTSYATIAQHKDTYCGLGMDLGRLTLQPDGTIGAKAWAVEGLQQVCGRHITYGWVLNYPSVLIASALTDDHDSSRLAVLLRFYLSRILNGMFVALVMLRLVQLIHRHGLRPGAFLLLGFCLAPLLLQQSWSVNADVPVNLLALELAILAIYIDCCDKWDAVLFAVVGAVACSSKPIITPLIPGILMAAYGFHDPESSLSWSYLRRLLTKKFVMIGLAAMVFGVVTSFLQIGAEKSKGQSHIQEQLTFALEHPSIVWAMVNNQLKAFFAHGIHFFSGSLGYFKVQTPPYILMAYPRLLAFFLTVEATLGISLLTKKVQRLRKIELNWQKSAYLGLSSLFTVITLYVSAAIPVFVMYLVWTKPGALDIEGVQARYFYPVVLSAIGFVGGSFGLLIPKGAGESKLENISYTRSKIFGVLVFVTVAICYWMLLFLNIARHYYAQ